MTFLSNLEWRHATKSFDDTKKVSDQDLQSIKESICMAPTSFGLQPFEVKIITDPEVLAKLRPHAWDQVQITSCSHLLVFCAQTEVFPLIDRYFEVASRGDKEAKKALEGYEEFMTGYFKEKDDNFVLPWAKKQLYIALGFAMAACAEIKVDSCPIEGFSPEEYDKILNLPENLKSTVLLPIGYREEDPERPKVRVTEEQMFT